MTEKRFKEIISIETIVDNKTGLHYKPVMLTDDFLDLINEIADENKQLKSRADYLERKIQRERNSYQKQHEKWEKELME